MYQTTTEQSEYTHTAVWWSEERTGNTKFKTWARLLIDYMKDRLRLDDMINLDLGESRD